MSACIACSPPLLLLKRRSIVKSTSSQRYKDASQFIDMSLHFQAIASLDRVWGKEALKRLIPEDLHLLANDWQRKIASEQLYRVLDAWHIWRSQVLSSQCSDDLVRVAVGTFTLNAHKSPCKAVIQKVSCRSAFPNGLKE